MFCRRAWQRIGPVARSSFTPPCRAAAPVRHMSFGVPGGSTNMTYVVLCGGGLTAAIVYAYKTVRGDSERYEDRLANMGSAATAVETSPVKEAELATEVVTESVPVEPVAETAAELTIEVVAKDSVAVTSEVVVAEAEAAPAVTEEAAPPVVVEAVAEDAPVTEGVDATAETLAEAPAAETVGTASVDEVLRACTAEAETEPAAAEAEAIPVADVAA